MEISSLTAKQLIKKFRLPPKPEVLSALQQELAKAEPDPIDYADIISQDVALSALVLKTVNSPVYGLNKEFSDIRKAVILLGLESLNNLVTYTVLKQSMQGKASISLEKFWDNSMEIALMSRLVAIRMADIVRVKADELYALCLFRDCGIPVMAIKYEDYKSVLIEANQSEDTIFTDIEEQYYETNHAIIGYFISSSWNLSKSLCKLILRHHDPKLMIDARVSDSQKDLFALMKIASLAACQYRYHKQDSEWATVKDQVLSHFGLSDLEFNEILLDLTDEFEAQYGELSAD
jgi:HD-like signal output (HDOD) protein